MKKLLFLITLSLISSIASASHMVSGYIRSNGTYIEPHMSMDPYESQRTGLSYRDNELVERDN